MSKKHYERIAAIVKAMEPPPGPSHAMWTNMAMKLADFFKKDNSKFNVRKFLLACNAIEYHVDQEVDF